MKVILFRITKGKYFLPVDFHAIVGSLAICDSSLYTLVSSANILNVKEILDNISLTSIRNKIGPKIVPWGTPAVTQDQDDRVP